ncbi:MAG: serine/threonine-protein phosphatase, partial [Clostridia bacterium]|nr:serine/threonine-protein phosphatase [Clostridia bacterium]
VQELVSAGQITDEQARSHPNRNIITRALGVEPYLHTDYNTADFPEESMLMICTDGLCGYFSDEQLLGLMQGVSGDELVSNLINAAKEQGGRDNITVALIEG